MAIFDVQSLFLSVATSCNKLIANGMHHATDPQHNVVMCFAESKATAEGKSKKSSQDTLPTKISSIDACKTRVILQPEQVIEIIQLKLSKSCPEKSRKERPRSPESLPKNMVYLRRRSATSGKAERGCAKPCTSTPSSLRCITASPAGATPYHS